MDWGIKNRLSKIIQPSTGKTVMLAVDHGYFLGPLTKLEDPKKTIEPLVRYADALMLTRGVLRTCVDEDINTPVVLRVSGGNSIAGGELSDESLTVSMKDAIRLNVSAVAISIYVATEHQNRTLTNLAKLVDEGEEFGIPVLAVTAVGKELEKRDAKYLSLCCRIAAELGAHFVKTYYCDNFEKISKSCPVPIVIAGGPKMNSEKEVFETAFNAIQQGATGVDMGRNIWQNENPVGMIKAVRHIVHKKGTVKEALELLDSTKPKK